MKRLFHRLTTPDHTIGRHGEGSSALLAGLTLLLLLSLTSYAATARVQTARHATSATQSTPNSVSTEKITLSERLWQELEQSLNTDGQGPRASAASAPRIQRLVQAIAASFDETKLTAGDGAPGDVFGFSVSVSGDRVVVGAPFDADKGAASGSAYIYDYDGGSWTETKLTAGDGTADDFFGVSVSVSGDRVVVGAYLDDDKGAASGSAYIYDYDGGSWTETKLTAGDGAADDVFGNSVSVSGDRVVVGAAGDDDNGATSGSAYVYDYDGASWRETKLTAGDGAAGDVFGHSVSVSGDRVVVGAPFDADKGAASGSAYIYDYDGGSWTETKLTAGDGAADDFFSVSVSVSGDRVVVGAYLDDDKGGNSGSAYVYDFDGASWRETKLAAGDGAADDVFGHSVSVSGDRVVVGAAGDNGKGAASGSAYVYDFDGASWTEKKLTAGDGAAEDVFGRSVSVSGDRVVVGAAGDDDKGASSGSAYVYALSADSDGDGVVDEEDNCPSVSNPDQADFDGDSLGDACDPDDDNDGVSNADELANGTNPRNPDTDGDGTPDGIDAFPNDPTEIADSDGDGVGENADAFPDDPNESADSDGDGIGDNADTLVANAGEDQAVCEGGSVVLGGDPTASGSVGDCCTYSWSPSDFLDNPGSANPSASPPATLAYTVTVADAVGNLASDEVTVTVFDLPTVDAGSNVSILLGQSTNIGGSPTAEGLLPLTYDWTPSDELSSATDANPTATPDATTTYQVTVGDANSCSADASVIVTVLAPEEAAEELESAVGDAIADPETPDDAQNELEKASTSLDEAVSLLENGEVKKAYNELAKALSELEKAEDAGADVASTIEALMELAAQIAENALVQARAFGGNTKSSNALAKAEEEFAAGVAEQSAGNLSNALDLYARAWENSKKAVEAGGGVLMRQGAGERTAEADAATLNMSKAASEAPENYVLEGNYPNPFNPQTTLRFGLPEEARVRLTIYDALGRLVAVPVDGALAAGMHEVSFTGEALPSGIYIYRLETPSGFLHQTMSLAK